MGLMGLNPQQWCWGYLWGQREDEKGGLHDVWYGVHQLSPGAHIFFEVLSKYRRVYYRQTEYIQFMYNVRTVCVKINANFFCPCPPKVILHSTLSHVISSHHQPNVYRFQHCILVALMACFGMNWIRWMDLEEWFPNQADPYRVTQRRTQRFFFELCVLRCVTHHPYRPTLVHSTNGSV